MPNTEEQKIANNYSQLMKEVKSRLTVLDERLSTLKDPNHLRPGAFIDAEYCFLQIRLICESIALAAILIHEPAYTNKLKNLYRADRIFTDLKKINRFCFPRAITGQPKVDGVVQYQVDQSESRGYKWLIKIYRETDQILHRGRIKHLIEGSSRHYPVDKVYVWASELRSLLKYHSIVDQTTGFAIICELKPEGQPVSVILGSG